MDSHNQLREARDALADVYIQDKVRIEKLRLILEKEQGHPVSLETAREVGTDLLTFYKILAQGKKITRGGLKNKRA